MPRPRTGLCSNSECKIALIKGSAHPGIIKLGYGYCRACRNTRLKDWRNADKKEFSRKQKEYRIRTSEVQSVRGVKYSRTLKGRYNHLKKKLRKEGTSISAISRNFYIALILDNECHYCLGPLNLTGHGLDRIDNRLGHVCYNVVPCCKSCNRKKWDDTSYEEMLLLIPALREIKRRRELGE